MPNSFTRAHLIPVVNSNHRSNSARLPKKSDLLTLFHTYQAAGPLLSEFIIFVILFSANRKGTSQFQTGQNSHACVEKKTHKQSPVISHHFR